MAPIKTLIITQARVGSTRLPRKVLLKIKDETLLAMHLQRLKKSKLADGIVVATTTNNNDDEIVSLCNGWGFKTSRGSVDDVLDRFYSAASQLKPEWVVRVTSDCPLIDPVLIDAVIAFTQAHDADYGANVLEERFPDGQDIEVFKFSALEKAWKEAQLKSEREHVTPYIRNNADYKGGNLFKAVSFTGVYNYSDIRMTVDEPQDFELIKTVIANLGTERTWLQYTKYIIDNNLQLINGDIIRNEGLIKSLKND
jgi:spore coat polysaccharide biosynthesis protein SpsF